MKCNVYICCTNIFYNLLNSYQLTVSFIEKKYVANITQYSGREIRNTNIGIMNLVL